MVYCLDCKKHLCNKCLESREHILHRKINLLEIKPSKEEINLDKEYIDDLKKGKANLEKQRDIKLINLKKKLEEDKNNFENLYIEFVNNSEQKLKKGIYLNKKN